MRFRPQALVLTLLLACASPPEIESRYQPSANALEIVAVLNRHVPDDTYRFEPARDFTGRNVYRSSLLRLENLERAEPESLQAGHLQGVIAFSKARALERIRAFELAARQYRIAARREPVLAAEALRSADLCDSLVALGDGTVALRHEAETEAEQGTAPIEVVPPEQALVVFEARSASLESLLRSSEGTHHIAVVREEIERNDMERARYFLQLRELLPQGDVRAIGELQRVTLRHPQSKNASRHLLSLADLYANLSIEYVARHPPESLGFDPVEFRDFVDSGARIYEMVASRDGTPEKLEASRRLEAFLAFSLAVDRDRFTP